MEQTLKAVKQAFRILEKTCVDTTLAIARANQKKQKVQASMGTYLDKVIAEHRDVAIKVAREHGHTHYGLYGALRDPDDISITKQGLHLVWKYPNRVDRVEEYTVTWEQIKEFHEY
jgi:hypothetical protein